ncbi:four-helix bundle copper-binding protein [Azotobacter bryophylli]|uniref:Four-helix bundle copper-binding protein n=1 Tax=Azotobacter bryophylli TaxID=1986537 RepID=A0ABV7APT3_9GAMM
MSASMNESCIQACSNCALACETCSASCLRESDVQAMARCVALDMDCADFCKVAATLMARGSDYAKAVCQQCAEVCRACGEECARHEAEHCQRCAQACRSCAEECERMAA